MTSSTRPASSCPTCAAELPATVLACPSCGTLVHAAELTRLAGLAEAAERQGEVSAALGHWSAVVELLPAGAPQRPAIDARIAALRARLIDDAPARDAGAAKTCPISCR